jgi:hypothetical protein
MWAPQQNANVRNEVYCTSKTESMCAHEEIQGIDVSSITARSVWEFFFLIARYECLYQVRQRDVCMSVTAGRSPSSRTRVQVCIGRISGCVLVTTCEAFFGDVEQGYLRLNPSMCFASQPQACLKTSFNHDKEHDLQRLLSRCCCMSCCGSPGHFDLTDPPKSRGNGNHRSLKLMEACYWMPTIVPPVVPLQYDGKC